jgi:hypothetical protein
VGVNIALGTRAMHACPNLDDDGAGDVSIDELVVAVGNVLEGCSFLHQPMTAMRR